MAIRIPDKFSLWVTVLLIFTGCGEDTPEAGVSRINLDGTACLEIVNSRTLRDGFTGDFSIEIWASGSEDIPSAARSLFMIGNDDGGNEIAIYQGPNDSSLVYAFIDDQLLNFYSAPHFDWRDGRVHYFCLTRSGDFFSFYFDGARIANSRLNSPEVDIQNSNLLIGADYDPPGLNANLGNFFIGSVDEVRLWSRAMLSTEVSFHYQNPAKLTEHYDAGYKDDLLGLYRFNEETSDYVHDGSGHGNYANIIGTVSWE